jgi:hypothetical protein
MSILNDDTWASGMLSNVVTVRRLVDGRGGYDHVPAGRTVPPIAAYAIAAGIADLVTEWIVAGRAHELRELAPDLCYATLAPFLGDPDAHATAEQLEAA